jgi:hypothetical protein
LISSNTTSLKFHCFSLQVSDISGQYILKISSQKYQTPPSSASSRLVPLRSMIIRALRLSCSGWEHPARDGQGAQARSEALAVMFETAQGENSSITREYNCFSWRNINLLTTSSAQSRSR